MVKASNREMASTYPEIRMNRCPLSFGLATGIARAGATATLGVEILFIVVLLPVPLCSPRIAYSRKIGADCASAGAASLLPRWRLKGTNGVPRSHQSGPGQIPPQNAVIS